MPNGTDSVSMPHKDAVGLCLAADYGARIPIVLTEMDSKILAYVVSQKYGMFAQSELWKTIEIHILPVHY